MTLRLKAGNKFGAKRCEVGGEKFDSQAEARRWQELVLLERAREIGGLARQVRFDLIVNRQSLHDDTSLGWNPKPLGVYVADFRYIVCKTGETVIEDVKGGPIPSLSAWKIKHFEAQYGMKVQIIRMK